MAGELSVSDMQAHQPVESGKIRSRILALDFARGIAIIAMAVFHFTWDLEFFGFVERGLTLTIEWKSFARSIATSFLFLAGFSLVLGHGKAIRIRSFVKRFAMVAGAAAIISIATYQAMPQAPIFFGILHSIATASVIGLFFLRLPAIILVLTAIAVIIAPFYLRSEFFDAPLLWWVGLNANIPISNDYVPILPWFAPFLLGMAFAKYIVDRDFFSTVKQWKNNNFAIRLLAFLGRHSLITYLLHQPILLGIVWAYSKLVFGLI
jgi:uncharacterized membrane protein